MFFAIEADGLHKTRLAVRKKETDCIGYVTVQELEEQEKELQISVKMLKECMCEQAGFHMGLKYYDDFGFAMLKLIQVQHAEKECGYLAFFMRKNLFVFVEIKDAEEMIRTQFEKVLQTEGKNTTMEKVVFEFFDGFLREGNTVLEETEKNIINMEYEIVKGNIDKNLNQRIFELKRQLTIQKNYYRQLMEVGAALTENENRIFWQEEVKYFKMFTGRAEQLHQYTKQLCEDLVHMRETLDAALNYDLNSIMKVFTVVTTVFLPLSLIAGWYGMNFTAMPELSWIYGYPMVIILSILVVAGCLLFFKWKKLL